MWLHRIWEKLKILYKIIVKEVSNLKKKIYIYRSDPNIEPQMMFTLICKFDTFFSTQCHWWSIHNKEEAVHPPVLHSITQQNFR